LEIFQNTYSGKKISQTLSEKEMASLGVMINRSPKEFVKAIAQHRFWEREKR